MIRKMKIVRQHDEKDCGAACLAMISNYYKKGLSISVARQLVKTDKNGTNLFGIVDGAKKIGLFAEALSGNQTDFVNAIHEKEITFPIIAHIISDEGMYHYVVIYAFKDNYLAVADPAKGNVLIDVNKFLEQWTGNIVTFSMTNEFQKTSISRKKFSSFFSLLKGQWSKIFLILVASIIAALIGIIGAFVFEVVIDNFASKTGYEIEHDHSDTSDETNAFNKENYGNTAKGFNLVYIFLQKVSAKTSVFSFNDMFILVIAMYIFKSIFELLRGYFIIQISKKIYNELTLSYFNHVIDLPMDSISERQTGEYLSRFSDADAVINGISTVTVTLIFDSMMTICGGLLLFLLDEKLFLISLSMMFAYVIIYLIYKKKIEHANRDVMKNNAIVQSFFKESIDGIETVKAYSIENEIKKKSTSKFKIFIDSIVKNSFLAMSQDVLSDAVELVGTMIVLWVGFSMVLSGQFKTGLLITYYVLIGYFTGPIKNLIQLQPVIQKAIVAGERLNDILDLQTEEKEEQSLLFRSIDRIEYQHINFRYGNNELVLNDISLKIEKGQKIAIVGKSGCGKTTLVKLLLGFYEFEHGEILINNIHVDVPMLIQLRNRVAYVSQNDYFFADSIKNNLILGNDSIKQSEIEEICNICQIDEFIQSLPSSYETPLDENGLNLSSGQRQRLMIARALLKRPDILILDETTSNLDSNTEKIIKNNILELNITCIFIAHRLNIIKDCDYIYVMEKGSIIECGTHDNLLSKRGAYLQLWESYLHL